MTLVRWNPRHEMTQLRRELDRLFRAAEDNSDADANASIVWSPVVDIHEDSDAYEVRLDIPGMDKKDIKIDFSDGTLSISGERKVEHSEDTKTMHRIERSHGRFYRSIDFPSHVLAENIDAKYADGVLRIRIPKAEESKPKQIHIS